MVVVHEVRVNDCVTQVKEIVVRRDHLPFVEDKTEGALLRLFGQAVRCELVRDVLPELGLVGLVLLDLLWLVLLVNLVEFLVFNHEVAHKAPAQDEVADLTQKEDPDAGRIVPDSEKEVDIVDCHEQQVRQLNQRRQTQLLLQQQQWGGDIMHLLQNLAQRCEPHGVFWIDPKVVVLVRLFGGR